MYVKLHHLAIAVEDSDKTTDLFENVLGLKLSHREDVPTENARVSFFPIGESSFELVQALDPDSGMARFIQKRGPGIHHVCLEVDDIQQMVTTLKARGVKFTSEAPSPGAHDAQIIFIHPKSTGGVLIELRQGPPSEHTPSTGTDNAVSGEKSGSELTGGTHAG